MQVNECVDPDTEEGSVVLAKEDHVASHHLAKPPRVVRLDELDIMDDAGDVGEFVLINCGPVHARPCSDERNPDHSDPANKTVPVLVDILCNEEYWYLNYLYTSSDLEFDL